jgi:hypothetical protein
MATRMATITGNLQETIKKATEQSQKSAEESTRAGQESAKVSRQLNKLTLWIIGAAFLSAIAACIQAYAALHSGR